MIPDLDEVYDDDDDYIHPLPWRAGSQVGRTLYDATLTGDGGGKPGRLIGVMDTEEGAAVVVVSVNTLAKARAFTAMQSMDPGLWFDPTTAVEAYLQAALRELHAIIEGETPS
jgi:hypothetical protein